MKFVLCSKHKLRSFAATLYYLITQHLQNLYVSNNKIIEHKKSQTERWRMIQI
jgi:hypothetical protein